MPYYFTAKIRQEMGENIQKIRKKKGLKQVEVAIDAGINSSYYGKIERGIVNPSLEKVYRIIKSLKVSSSDILPF
jgi:transcriptional regulator with XRE-family HTH domain